MMLLSSALPLTHAEASQPVQLGGTAGDQGAPEALLCQGITPRVTAMCLSLLTGWVMPRCPQLERSRNSAMSFPIHCKSQTAEIRKGKSSLVGTDQFLLLFTLPEKKTQQTTPKPPLSPFH